MKHVYTSFLTFTLLTLTASSLYAQGPNDSGTYYAAAEGKKGAELKTALCEIINPHTQRTYGNLWTDFQTTDAKANGKVWDMYSNKREFTFVTDQTGSAGYKKEGDNYNREHSFPKSWFNDEYPMYTDLFHLYPTDAWVNNARGNDPFGEVGTSYTASENNFSKWGNARSDLGYSGKVFEPNDEYKGDFARTYFYMVTCYESYKNSNNQARQITSWNCVMLDGNLYPGLAEWALNMLMKWAKNDAVSTKETDRNKAVYGIQNNRNPFIDYPGLEEYIWGSMTDVAFSYNNYQVPTAIMTIKTEPTYKEGVMYNLSGQVVDKSYKGIVIMNGKKFVNK